MNSQKYMRYMALAFILIIECPLAFSAGERVVITFSTYSGKPEDSDQFRSSLDRTKNLLIQNIINKTKNTEYLKSLKIVETKNQFPSLTDFDKYWNDSDALEILKGSIDRQGEGQYFVNSQIYLGEFHHGLPSQSVFLEVPFSAKGYSMAMDSHAAFLFYSLAMDVQRVNPGDSALFSSLMKVSIDKLSEIKKNKNILNQSLIDLEKAIRNELKKVNK